MRNGVTAQISQIKYNLVLINECCISSRPDHVQTSLFTITARQNSTFSSPHFETKTPRWRSNPPEEENTVATEDWLGSSKADVDAGWSAGLAEQLKARPCGPTSPGMQRALGRARHGEQLYR